MRTRKEGGKEEGKERRRVCMCVGGGADSVGCSVTLEEIRRLSSPLMTAEIVFQWRGGGKCQSSAVCFFVALRASCVRFRLPVSLPPAAAHCLRATKGSTVLGGDRRSGSALAKPHLHRGILLCDFRPSDDNKFVCVCGCVPLQY